MADFHERVYARISPKGVDRHLTELGIERRARDRIWKLRRLVPCEVLRHDRNIVAFEEGRMREALDREMAQSALFRVPAG